VFVANRPTTSQEVNDAFRQEASSEQYQGILGVSEDPLVSADIVGDPRAAVIDLELTRVVDATLVKVMAWYDNEWGLHPTDDPRGAQHPRRGRHLMPPHWMVAARGAGTGARDGRRGCTIGCARTASYES
jgi:hypothetical protein